MKKKILYTLIGGLVLMLLTAQAPVQPLQAELTQIAAKMLALEEKYKAAPAFPFFQADVREVVNSLHQYSLKLSDESWKANNKSEKEFNEFSNLITEVSNEYFNLQTMVYTWYARSAHGIRITKQKRTLPRSGPEDRVAQTIEVDVEGPGSDIQYYDFSQLNYLNLNLNKLVAYQLMQKRPYNIRLKNFKTLELYLSEQDKQLAEYVALESYKSELNYPKLILFSALRENLNNRWAYLQMGMGQTASSGDQVNFCGTDFLSFKLPKNSTSIDQSPVILEALNLDKTMAFESLLANVTLSSKLAENISTVYSFNEYRSFFAQTFMKHKDLSKALKSKDEFDRNLLFSDAARKVQESEDGYWKNNGKAEILHSNTAGEISDYNQKLEVTANRIFDAHKEVANNAFLSIMYEDLKQERDEKLNSEFLNFMELKRSVFTASIKKSLSASLEQMTNKKMESAVKQEKLSERVEKTYRLASPSAMAAIQDIKLFESLSIPTTDIKAEAQFTPRQAKTGGKVYVLDKLKYRVDNTEDFKAWLQLKMGDASFLQTMFKKSKPEIEELSKVLQSQLQDLIKKVEADRASVIANHTSIEFYQSVKNQAWWQITQLNQSGNSKQKAFADSLKRVYTHFGMLNLNKSSDFILSTDFHRNFVDSVMTRLYMQDPLLMYRSDRTELKLAEDLSQNFNVSTGQFTINVKEKIKQYIREAAQTNFDNLHSFCKASVKNPSDQNFKDMFKASKAARQAYTQTPEMKKFDDHWYKKAFSLQERLHEEIVNPALMISMIAMLALMFFIPVAPLAVGAILMNLNLYLMFPLTAASVYFRFNANLVEKPAQIDFQEQMAGSLIADHENDPRFASWQLAKVKGATKYSTSANALSVKQSRMENQMELNMNFVFLPLDISYGKHVTKHVVDAVTKRYTQKALTEIMGEVASKTVLPEIKPAYQLKDFYKIAKQEGLWQAVKTDAKTTYARSQMMAGVEAYKPAAPFLAKDLEKSVIRKLYEMTPQNIEKLLPELKFHRKYILDQLVNAKVAGKIQLTENSELLIPLFEGQLEKQGIKDVTEQVAEAAAQKASAASHEGLNKGVNLFKGRVIQEGEEDLARQSVPQFVKDFKRFIKQDGISIIENEDVLLNGQKVKSEFIKIDLTNDDAVKFFLEAESLSKGRHWDASPLLKMKMRLKELFFVPDNALLAIKNGRFKDWYQTYREKLKMVSKLRARLYVDKLKKLDSMITRIEKIKQASGESVKEMSEQLKQEGLELKLEEGQWVTKDQLMSRVKELEKPVLFSSFTGEDIALFEEVSKGPRWFRTNYLFYKRKWAEMSKISMPIAASWELYGKYHQVISAFKPFEMVKWGTPVPKGSLKFKSDTEDFKDFYKKNLDLATLSTSKDREFNKVKTEIDHQISK